MLVISLPLLRLLRTKTTYIKSKPDTVTIVRNIYNQILSEHFGILQGSIIFSNDLSSTKHQGFSSVPPGFLE